MWISDSWEHEPDHWKITHNNIISDQECFFFLLLNDLMQNIKLSKKLMSDSVLVEFKMCVHSVKFMRIN